MLDYFCAYECNLYSKTKNVPAILGHYVTLLIVNDFISIGFMSSRLLVIPIFIKRFLFFKNNGGSMVSCIESITHLFDADAAAKIKNAGIKPANTT